MAVKVDGVADNVFGGVGWYVGPSRKGVNVVQLRRGVIEVSYVATIPPMAPRDTM